MEHQNKDGIPLNMDKSHRIIACTNIFCRSEFLWSRYTDPAPDFGTRSTI